MSSIRSKTWLADTLRKYMPKREEMARNKYLAPIAHRFLSPELWRFTRRSVPRGVALGLFAVLPWAGFAHSFAVHTLALSGIGVMTLSMMKLLISSLLTSGPCWALTTTVSIRTGVLPSYSTVT